MENFQKLTLDKCLENIEDFTGCCHQLELFMAHLYSIENVNEVFERLTQSNYEWTALANRVKPQAHINIIYVDNVPSPNPAELSLCIFDNGAIPVIRVTICERRTIKFF